MESSKDVSNFSTFEKTSNINSTETSPNTFNFAFICVVCCFSLTENVIVLIVFARKTKLNLLFCNQHRHRKRESSNKDSGVSQNLKYSAYFVVNMLIANLLITSTMMPFSLCAIWWNSQHDIFSDQLCQVFGFCINMIVAGLIYGTLGVTADRLFAVTKPMEYKRHVSKPKVVALIGISWTLSGLCAALPFTGAIFLPKLPYSFSRSSSMCFVLSDQLPMFYWLCVLGFFVFVYCLPLIFIVGAYICMFHAAHTIASKLRRRNTMGSILKPMVNTAIIGSKVTLRNANTCQLESNGCNIQCAIKVSICNSTGNLNDTSSCHEVIAPIDPSPNNGLYPKGSINHSYLKNQLTASSNSLGVCASQELTPCLSKSRSITISTASSACPTPLKFNLKVPKEKSSPKSPKSTPVLQGSSSTRNSSAVVRDGLTLIRNGSIALRRRLSKLVDQREEAKAAKTSCIIIASFISLISPYFFAMLFTATRIFSPLQEHDALLRRISILLLYTNCAVTPAVYVYRDSSLRAEIRRTFSQILRSLFSRKSNNSQPIPLIAVNTGKLSRKPSFYSNYNGTRLSLSNMWPTTTNPAGSSIGHNIHDAQVEQRASSLNVSIIDSTIEEDDFSSHDSGPWYLQ